MLCVDTHVGAGPCASAEFPSVSARGCSDVHRALVGSRLLCQAQCLVSRECPSGDCARVGMAVCVSRGDTGPGDGAWPLSLGLAEVRITDFAVLLYAYS